MKYLPYWLLAAVATIADQATKYAVLARFEYRERLNIIPNFFDLTLVYNPGAAFSFLAEMGGAQKYIFTVLAFAISGWLAHGIVKSEFGRIGNWAAACIIGGAAGNGIDRFVHGHVVDFLLFYWRDHYYPAFNVADSFICVGAVLLAWDSIRHKKDGADSAHGKAA